MASRPGVSDQPGNSASADFRASADSRSAMPRLLFSRSLYPNTAGQVLDPRPK
jgi:hypothetical protein